MSAIAAEVRTEPDGLVVTGISKSYGSTQALRRLDLRAPRGEITGIAGPNGAGKSTFVGILGGELRADGGRIAIDGQPLGGAAKPGRVAVVHQEPQLFPNLAVWENVVVGHEAGLWFRPSLPKRVEQLLDDFALTPFRDAELATVPLAAQQRVEIVRALARSVQVLVFDEPNSALSEAESSELFAYMRRLADEGRVVLLVSHRIGELVEHCASVVVILDGEDRVVLRGAELTEKEVARRLVDDSSKRPAEEQRQQRSSGGERHPNTLVVKGSAASPHANVEVRFPPGEVTAFVGVEGSGARAFVQALGASRAGDRSLRFVSAEGAAAIVPRVEFVPAHRQESLFPNLSVAENIASRLAREITGPVDVVSSRRVGVVAERARMGMQIKVGAMHDPIATLSGGNQQKVAIAAAIARDPALLVLEEPTRGVDIGSRAEIYRILAEYAEIGRTVCLYCTEIVEAYRAAHRAIVFQNGRIVADLVIADFENVRELSHRIVEAGWE